MDLGLKGLKAVVTGGSQGIGRAIVRTLAEEGCAVEFCARNPDGVEQTVRELSGEGRLVGGTALDVRDPPAVRAWLAAVGAFDIFVPNVSALADDWTTTIATDVTATIEATEAAARIVRRSAHGAITFIGSKTASYAAPHSPAYAAMKAGMAHYMKSLSLQLMPAVRVNVVSPGDILFPGGYWDGVRLRSPSLFEATERRNPLGRMGTAEEVARVVAFISSPAASFVTGSNWYVDGGSVSHVQI